MNTIFGTFVRFINNPDGSRKIVLNNLSDDFGDKVFGYVHIGDEMVIARLTLKFGDRYMVKYQNMVNKTLTKISHTKKVNKNPRCDIFRRFKSDFHIIGGKYKGKKVSELDKLELNKYCIWLGQHSYNEMTIKNVLTILKRNHESTIKPATS